MIKQEIPQATKQDLAWLTEEMRAKRWQHLYPRVWDTVTIAGVERQGLVITQRNAKNEITRQAFFPREAFCEARAKAMGAG